MTRRGNQIVKVPGAYPSNGAIVMGITCTKAPVNGFISEVARQEQIQGAWAVNVRSHSRGITNHQFLSFVPDRAASAM